MVDLRPPILIRTSNNLQRHLDVPNINLERQVLYVIDDSRPLISCPDCASYRFSSFSKISKFLKDILPLKDKNPPFSLV